VLQLISTEPIPPDLRFQITAPDKKLQGELSKVLRIPTFLAKPVSQTGPVTGDMTSTQTSAYEQTEGDTSRNKGGASLQHMDAVSRMQGDGGDQLTRRDSASSTRTSTTVFHEGYMSPSKGRESLQQMLRRQEESESLRVLSRSLWNTDKERKPAQAADGLQRILRASRED
jgi:hypothetical protein